MGTPLYKPMKVKGTSFYAFPSASQDLNLANNSEDYKINFTKFVLLNIPQQQSNRNTPRDRTSVLDFLDKSNSGDAPFFSSDPNQNLPTNFSDQLVESLRNYVANYDTAMHESRINTNTDFYNIGERYTPTEHIFYKWCRKLNLIDFEPAIHKVDWDKNLSDFDNTNASTTTYTDYFRKYLWKERETISYSVSSVLEDGTYQYGGQNTPKLTINEQCKFKVGDLIQLSGTSVTGAVLSTGVTYIVGQVQITGSSTWVWLDYDYQGDGNHTNLSDFQIFLYYHRLIQYIGEINQISNVQTASRTGQEITAYIPHHVGATPTILFGTRANTNYYPNLEIPFLSSEIQDEIIGAENLNSPIITDPQDYPGSFWGQYDTDDSTYLCSDGDKVRFQGDYYGIQLTNNVGLNAEDYFEDLSDFNSDNIDGVYVDFNRDHYYKMQIPGLEVNNFDEFNSISIEEEPPADFDFNAILWYYELIEQDNQGNATSYVNLYGIEFLNNPDNDDDAVDGLMTPYHKLVTNGSQDGLSYIFNLNVHYNIDNDVLPLTYDPSTIYNMFGFDLYNEMMKKYYRVNENFINIIQEFVRINLDIQNMKSLIYSQSNMEELKSRMNNMEELLKLYQTNQFMDSDTAKISVDNSGIYPRLKFNVVGVEYDEILNVYASTAYNYNFSNTGSSYSVPLSFTNKMLLNIINDNVSTDSGNVFIALDRDLLYKQRLDIVIKPSLALYYQRLYLNMIFNYNNSLSEQNILSIDLPTNVTVYNVANPTGSTFTNSYYTNENVYTNSTDVVTGYTYCETGFTNITITEDLFASGDTIYIQNLYFRDTSGNTRDFSGAYRILQKSGIDLVFDLLASDVAGFVCIGQPIVSYYRGIQISFLRVSESNTSSFNERYNVTYKII